MLRVAASNQLLQFL